MGIGDIAGAVKRFAAYFNFFGFAGYYNPQGPGGSSSRIN